jgi:hypothetical protein
LGGANEQAGNDHLLVNINPTTTLIHDLHWYSPFACVCLSMKHERLGYQKIKRVLCLLLLSRATCGGA